MHPPPRTEASYCTMSFTVSSYSRPGFTQASPSGLLQLRHYGRAKKLQTCSRRARPRQPGSISSHAATASKYRERPAGSLYIAAHARCLRRIPQPAQPSRQADHLAALPPADSQGHRSGNNVMRAPPQKPELTKHTPQRSLQQGKPYVPHVLSLHALHVPEFTG